MASGHAWERGPVVNGAMSMRCTQCGRLWLPDQTLDQQGRCPAKEEAGD